MATPVEERQLVRQFGSELAGNALGVPEVASQFMRLTTVLKLDTDDWLIKDNVEQINNLTSATIGSEDDKQVMIRTLVKATLVRYPEEGEPDVVGASSHLEGVTWEDRNMKAYRKYVTALNGSLLKAFVQGMTDGGYERTRAEDSVREVIDDILGQLEGRGGYGAVAAVRHIHKIYDESGLHNPDTLWKRIARGLRFQHDFGFDAYGSFDEEGRLSTPEHEIIDDEGDDNPELFR